MIVTVHEAAGAGMMAVEPVGGVAPLGHAMCFVARSIAVRVETESRILRLSPAGQ